MCRDNIFIPYSYLTRKTEGILCRGGFIVIPPSIIASVYTAIIEEMWYDQAKWFGICKYGTIIALLLLGGLSNFSWENYFDENLNENNVVFSG